MRIEFVDNAVKTISAVLTHELIGCSKAFLASAFITELGLNELRPAIRRAAVKADVRVLTGIYEFFNEPEMFRRLLALSLNMRRLEVRVSEDVRFHQKLYLFEQRQTITAVVGSSNLTGDGLGSAGEFNVVLRAPKTSMAARRLIEHAERLWSNDTILLGNEWIDRYVRLRPRRPKTPTPSRLRLFPKSITSRNERSERPSKIWIDVVTGVFDDGTKRAVNSETGWSKRGYEYYAAGSATSMNNGDLLCLFDYNMANAGYRLLKVEDARNDLDTPDGKHFVAFSPYRRFKRTVLTLQRKAILRAAGVLLTRRNTRRRVIGAAAFAELEALARRRNGRRS